MELDQLTYAESRKDSQASTSLLVYNEYVCLECGKKVKKYLKKLKDNYCLETCDECHQ